MATETTSRKKINVSLCGCGFLGIYHVGVVNCLKEFEEHLEIVKFAGASAGAITAACYLTGVCWGEATKDVLKTAAAARVSPIGPFSPRFNITRILRKGLSKLLPDDAHELCRGKLVISLTRVRDGVNVMVDQFDSKEELVEALMCSSYVPFYSGLIPPMYRGVRYWDGGISNNLPILDHDTITVSPFSGESDICPSDGTLAIMEMNLAKHSIHLTSRNIYRMSRALFPPHPDILTEICEEGYMDAMQYVRKRLLPDTKAVILKHPDFLSRETSHDNQDSDILEGNVATVPEPVIEAEMALEMAKGHANRDTVLPYKVLEALREASNAVPHPAIRALTFMAMPMVLPIEFMYSTCVKVIDLVPRRTFDDLIRYVEQLSRAAHRSGMRIVSQHKGRLFWNFKCTCSVEKSRKQSQRGSCRHDVTYSFSITFGEKSGDDREELDAEEYPDVVDAVRAIEMDLAREESGDSGRSSVTPMVEYGAL